MLNIDWMVFLNDLVSLVCDPGNYESVLPAGRVDAILVPHQPDYSVV